MGHSRYLDFFLYRDLCGDEIKSLQMHVKPETQNGQLLLELKDALPGYIKWFLTSSERNKLTVRFGVMCQLMGFSLKQPDIADNMHQMRSGTHSGRFCVFAIEMVELLRQMGSQSMSQEVVAEMILSVKSDVGALPAGMDPSDRRARRSPEVQKRTRQICQLVQSIRAKFPPDVLTNLCEKRQLHVGALDATFDRMITSLRTAAPAAGMAGTEGPNGTACIFFETINRLGELMPDWTPQDMYDINLHAIALAELASDINVRVQAAFGGNFPALVWLNDCYEFDPNNAHKNMHLLRENEISLYWSTLVARALFESGHFTPQPIEADAEAQAGLSDATKPGLADDGGGEQAAASATTPRERAVSARGGKKKKGKR